MAQKFPINKISFNKRLSLIVVVIQASMSCVMHGACNTFFPHNLTILIFALYLWFQTVHQNRKKEDSYMCALIKYLSST